MFKIALKICILLLFVYVFVDAASIEATTKKDKWAKECDVSADCKDCGSGQFAECFFQMYCGCRLDVFHQHEQCNVTADCPDCKPGLIKECIFEHYCGCVFKPKY